jgi:hypothetical protein
MIYPPLGREPLVNGTLNHRRALPIALLQEDDICKCKTAESGKDDDEVYLRPKAKPIGHHPFTGEYWELRQPLSYRVVCTYLWYIAYHETRVT